MVEKMVIFHHRLKFVCRSTKKIPDPDPDPAHQNPRIPNQILESIPWFSHPIRTFPTIISGSYLKNLEARLLEEDHSGRQASRWCCGVHVNLGSYEYIECVSNLKFVKETFLQCCGSGPSGSVFGLIKTSQKSQKNKILHNFYYRIYIKFQFLLFFYFFV